jgi:hypothetical protein
MFSLLLYTNCLPENQFLDDYWKTPIPEQGDVPKEFSSLESSLSPKACGSCHKDQFQAWNESLHSKTISNGFLWQIPSMQEKDVRRCLSCHSPMTESQAYLLKNFNFPVEIKKEWKVYLDSDISYDGLSCANCHLRNHQRFGPPKQSKSNTFSSRTHNSFNPQPEFEESYFCKKCHDSPDDANQIKGKKLMEVYKEWSESRFAKEGVQCQTCHMPERKHLWKGIHDKDMVNSGIEKDLVVKIKDLVEVTAFVKSVNIGHKFPTYSVPKIYIRIWKLEEGKKTILDERIIGRILDTSLTQEMTDTRLLPGETLYITSSFPKSKTPITVFFEAEVEPKEMYQRVFQEKLNSDTYKDLDSKEKAFLLMALKESKQSKYKLFQITKKINAD